MKGIEINIEISGNGTSENKGRQGNAVKARL